MSPPQNAAVGAIAAVTPPLPATHRVPAGCDPHPPPGCYPKIPPPTRKQPQIRGDRTRRWGCETPDCTGTSPLSPGGSLVPRGPSRGAGVAPSPARAGGAGKGGFKPAPAAAGAPVERTRPPGAAKRRKANGGAREAPRWSPPRPAAVSGAGSASGGGQTPPHLRPPVSPPRGPDRPPTPSYRVRGRPPRAVPPPGFKRFVPPPLLPYWSPEGWGASRGEEDEGKLPIPAAPCRRAGLARAALGGAGRCWPGRSSPSWAPPSTSPSATSAPSRISCRPSPVLAPCPPGCPPRPCASTTTSWGGWGSCPPPCGGCAWTPRCCAGSTSPSTASSTSTRSYVLSQLSHLTSLDFSAVTKQDREDAAIAQRGKKKGGGPGRRAAPLAP
ncbi:leucine-rich repeat-containing protein 51 isoform X4 [Columba livia]|uniref:leucine-rich repeat-containing protein 51 isoform X4 n=1 Tax=Columba livia TaxID=8932 RepID=UPI0031BB1CE0